MKDKQHVLYDCPAYKDGSDGRLGRLDRSRDDGSHQVSWLLGPEGCECTLKEGSYVEPGVAVYIKVGVFLRCSICAPLGWGFVLFFFAFLFRCSVFLAPLGSIDACTGICSGASLRS